MAHISNFFTSRVQVELAERILAIAGAPEGSGVFFANSGAEAIEAAIKLSRRTGRTGIVAAEGAFHGRTTGALALTHKAAYREPFAPLLDEVSHVPFNDIEALRAAVTTSTAAVVLEPVQGEAGAVVADPAYLRAAREITTAAGALLVIDEVQSGIGRTGDWFGHTASGIVPDAITLAKGLGGGLPIGALVTFGPDVTGLLTAGQHGSTFGGNPLVAAAALSVLATIEADGLLDARHADGRAPRRRGRRARAPGRRRRSGVEACCAPSSCAPTSPPASPPRPVTPASSSTRSHRTPSGSSHRSPSPRDELDLFVTPPALIAASLHRHRQGVGTMTTTVRHFLRDDDVSPQEQAEILDRAAAIKSRPFTRPHASRGRRSSPSSSTSRPCAPRSPSPRPSPTSAASRSSSTASSPRSACASRSPTSPAC